MQNENHTSKKIILGLVIGAMAGAGVLYCIHASRQRRTPILHKIGRTMSEVGEMLENSEIESFSDVVHEVQEALPQSKDVISSLLNWLSSGMSLWKKIKHGG